MKSIVWFSIALAAFAHQATNAAEPSSTGDALAARLPEGAKVFRDLEYVPIGQSELLHAALTKVCVGATFFVMKGAGHGVGKRPPLDARGWGFSRSS